MAKDPLVNTRLNGYFIESLLGRGGMARVYRGVDVNSKHYVAIKVINAVYRDNPDAASRFEREARVIASLGGHPSVVRLEHYGEDQGYLFIAMQYIEGADLAAILRSYREDGVRMQMDEIVTIGRDMAAALDYIHAKDVVHRDLKPSNIMLNSQGRAILTDFGLALLVDVGTMGDVFGSPAYIAPEQAISSAGAVPASDLYALGVILFEMLTGQTPFRGDDALNLAMQHVHTAPPSPSSIRPDLGPEIDRVILRALSKKPEERCASAAELMRDLEQAMALSPAERPIIADATMVKLSIPERVRQENQPLPPPSLPPGAPETIPPTPPPPQAVLPPVRPPALPQHPPPPATIAPNSGAAAPRQYGQGAIYSVPAPEGGGSMVIPLARREKPAWVLPAVLAGLTLLVVGALCLGGALAARAVLSGDKTTPTEFAYGGGEQTVIPSVAVIQAPPLAPTEAPALPLDSSPTPNQGLLPMHLQRLGQGHLLIANISQYRLYLPPLQLGEGRDALVGSALGPQALDPNECIVILYPFPGKKPKPPGDLECHLVMVLTRERETGFWNNQTFTIYYNSEPVGQCIEDEKICVIELPRQ